MMVDFLICCCDVSVSEKRYVFSDDARIVAKKVISQGIKLYDVARLAAG